jgi:hypothetical protein
MIKAKMKKRSLSKGGKKQQKKSQNKEP